MTYTEDITLRLIKVLEKNSLLDRGQLAGHAQNLSFWADEVTHCRQVLKGYDARFSAQRRGQIEAQDILGKYVLQQYDSRSALSGPPMKAALTAARIKELDQLLTSSFRAFVIRCMHEEIIDHLRADEIWKVCCSDLDLAN